jgi:hypothetical protein
MKRMPIAPPRCRPQLKNRSQFQRLDLADEVIAAFQETRFRFPLGLANPFS